MSHQSDPQLLVSLALRLKGFGDIDAISSVHALDSAVTQGALSLMIDENKCVMRQVEGVDKYVLTRREEKTEKSYSERSLIAWAYEPQYRVAMNNFLT